MPKVVKIIARIDFKTVCQLELWLETLLRDAYRDFRDDDLSRGFPASPEFAEFIDYVA